MKLILIPSDITLNSQKIFELKKSILSLNSENKAELFKQLFQIEYEKKMQNRSNLEDLGLPHDSSVSLKLDILHLIGHIRQKYKFKNFLIVWKNLFVAAPEYLFLYDPDNHYQAIASALIESPSVYHEIMAQLSKSDQGGFLHPSEVPEIHRFLQNDTTHIVYNNCHQKTYGFSMFDFSEQNDQDTQSQYREIMARLRIFFIHFDFIFKNSNRNSIFWNAFAVTEEKIFQWITDCRHSQKRCSLGYFNFYNQDRYFNQSGEVYYRDLLEEMKQVFQKRTLENEQLLILAPDEYILFAPDCDAEKLQQRFPEKSFHIRGLIISFRSNFITIDPSENSSRIWGRLYGHYPS